MVHPRLVKLGEAVRPQRHRIDQGLLGFRQRRPCRADIGLGFLGVLAIEIALRRGAIQRVFAVQRAQRAGDIGRGKLHTQIGRDDLQDRAHPPGRAPRFKARGEAGIDEQMPGGQDAGIVQTGGGGRDNPGNGMAPVRGLGHLNFSPDRQFRIPLGLETGNLILARGDGFQLIQLARQGELNGLLRLQDVHRLLNRRELFQSRGLRRRNDGRMGFLALLDMLIFQLCTVDGDFRQTGIAHPGRSSNAPRALALAIGITFPDPGLDFVTGAFGLTIGIQASGLRGFNAGSLREIQPAEFIVRRRIGDGRQQQGITIARFSQGLKGVGDLGDGGLVKFGVLLNLIRERLHRQRHADDVTRLPQILADGAFHGWLSGNRSNGNQGRHGDGAHRVHHEIKQRRSGGSHATGLRGDWIVLFAVSVT